MRHILKLLLITLLLGTTLLAEVFHKPDYDPRLSIDQRALEWWNHADTDSASAFNIGLLYQKRIHDNKLAELWYKQALNINDKDVESMFNLGMLYESEKKNMKAIEMYNQAYTLQDSKSANNLGLLYANKQDYKKALKYYQKAIERESLSAMKNLSLLYYKQLHDTPKAVEYFIPLIDKKYSKEKVLKFFKVKYKADDKTIKQGYEEQLKSKVIPEKLKYKGGI
jgi:uncharacterized protein